MLAEDDRPLVLYWSVERGRPIIPAALAKLPSALSNVQWIKGASTSSESRTRVVPVSRSHLALETSPELTWKQVLERAENDFEVPVFKAHPLLRDIKQQLISQGAKVALLSGSGATVFGVFSTEAGARSAQAFFLNEQTFKVFVAETCSGS